jgi:Uma2 family endonuclease
VVPTKLFRWTTERYLALVESGIVPSEPGIELIDGLLFESIPQGQLHYFIFSALQRVFATMGAFERGLVVQPTLIVSEGNVFDPEFVVLKNEAIGILELPSASRALLVIEVSVTSRAHDLGAKREAYAGAGIPEYWVVDGLKRGVYVFSEPRFGIYEQERFTSAEGILESSVLSSVLELSAIFPADASAT